MTKFKPVFKLFGLWLLWRAGLLLVGIIANRFLDYKPSFAYFDTLLPIFGWPQWFYSWGGFDGVHYLNLARAGYIGTGLVQAFFPVWPGLIAGFHRLTGIDILLTGLILSSFFGFGVILLLKIIWQTLLGPKLTNWSLAWWFIFPTSFFLTAIYTESLFLVLALGCYLAASKKNWWLAAGLAAIATGTRIVGIWLVPMLWLMALDGVNWQGAQLWAGLKKAAPVLLICSFGSLGLLSYMTYLWLNFHDPLYFLHQQSAFGAGRQASLVLWPQVAWRGLHILLTARPFDWKYLTYTQEFLFGISSLAILAWGWWQRSKTKLSLGLLVYSLGCIIMPTLTGTFSSLPRYILVAWPIWQILAVWSVSHPRIAKVGLAFSLILLIINTALFIQGYWVA